jgi:hypothetical protein
MRTRVFSLALLTALAFGAAFVPQQRVQALAGCDRGEDIEDDDWPLENEWFHAKAGTYESLPDADPLGEEEWTFHGATWARFADMHSTWETGRSMQGHGPCTD